MVDGASSGVGLVSVQLSLVVLLPCLLVILCQLFMVSGILLVLLSCSLPVSLKLMVLLEHAGVGGAVWGPPRSQT